MTDKRSDQYRDPRWQKKRLEILSNREWQCEDCGEKEKELHVHHTYYVPTRKPWEYPDFAFAVVCDNCHRRRHEPRNEDDLTGEADVFDWELLLGAIEAEKNCGDLFDLAREIAKLKAEIGRNAVMGILFLALISNQERIGISLTNPDAPWYPGFPLRIAP